MAPPLSEIGDPPRLPMPSRNPLPLTASQEAQVRELYHERVRGFCAEEIKEFAECVIGRTLSAPFVCRPQRLRMNTCMISHATQAERDASREEWFATRLKRQKEREAKEEKRKEQKKFHREWWGLPMEDLEEGKGTEVVVRAERVGGFRKKDDGQMGKDRHR